jgi:trimethylamine--corrinoid protein Co-methyltransferase
MGMLDMGMTLSFQQLVVDHEIARMILRVVRGIQVSGEHLALDVIAQVGIGGHYLAEDHTLEHFKTEAVEAMLFERDNFDGWLARGKREIKEIAAEKARDILQNHEVDPLAQGVEEEFRKIIGTME